MSYLIFGLHFVGFALGVGCLLIQLTLLSSQEAGASTRVMFLSRVDAVFGGAAVLSLATGLFRVFLYGKGFGYYSTHLVFWLKMALFAMIGIASILPTVSFLQHRMLTLSDWRANRPEQIRRVTRLIRFELFLYLLIPFVAALLAHGPHLSG